MSIPYADCQASPNICLHDGMGSQCVLSCYCSSTHVRQIATATTTGALSTTVLAPSIPHLPPGPNSTSYPRDGKLHGTQPIPIHPPVAATITAASPSMSHSQTGTFNLLYVSSLKSTQQGTNCTQSLAVYQEYIELDLFRYVLKRFSVEEWEAQGINAEYRYLIEFMAEQEVGHAEIISNMLCAASPKPCSYNYPFDTVPGFLEYAKKNTRYGESGTYGFLSHMDSGAAASLVQASIATEARQQAAFRQLQGLFVMPVNFIVATPQSWQWTLLAPDIAWCPADQTRLVWQNFPALKILNEPNATSFTGASAISHNTSALSHPGMEIELLWENPGKLVGPNDSYVTSTTAGPAKFVGWVNQVNVTYTPLQSISLGPNCNFGTTLQPGGVTLGGSPIINETTFVVVTDSDLFVTPYNLTMLNPHIVAGPALYSAG
ncbi:hypothetical protein ACLOAV_008347 [Pseudogymnoascus australis]